MLNENIKAIRKSKGLSQEELAIKLNVVRQTISKWEKGLSVPDSNMLISISEVLETPVSTLLGETVVESKVDDLKAISEKLVELRGDRSQGEVANAIGISTSALSMYDWSAALTSSTVFLLNTSVSIFRTFSLDARIFFKYLLFSARSVIYN